MTRDSVVLAAATASELSLRVVFTWQNDRFGHVIERVQAGQTHAVLASVEGMDAESCPWSPPLQQLHVEPRGDGDAVALLVGMAGKEHWSLSVEVGDEGRSLTFDVACRVGSRGTRLRSVYAFAEPPAEYHETFCRGSGGTWTLRALAIGGPESAAGQLSLLSDWLAVLPAATQQRTVRWKYRIGLEG